MIPIVMFSAEFVKKKIGRIVLACCLITNYYYLMENSGGNLSQDSVTRGMVSPIQPRASEGAAYSRTGARPFRVIKRNETSKCVFTRPDPDL
jgi:hypothetical protein